jgi:hypothetical protein
MHKASEWAGKFLDAPVTDDQSPEVRYAGVLKEYGEETAKLFAERTKNSKPDSKFPAAEGAIREQKNKFRSICSRVPGLTNDIFEKMLDVAVPEYKQLVAAAEAAKKSQDDDVEEYRKNRFFGDRKIKK